MDCKHCEQEMECVEDDVRSTSRKPYGVGERYFECQNDECPFFTDEDGAGERYTETETEDDRAADYADYMYDALRDA